jgi:antitoxin (DNA-binding transcriptional repressor) of toxin-antitoxin stability system
MDWNRLISMLTRMFLRKAVTKGISLVARRGKAVADLTPQDRKQARAARQMADKAQKAARLGRRFLR